LKKKKNTDEKNLSSFDQILWVIFAVLDPDLCCQSGSKDPIESGSNPDPQHYFMSTPKNITQLANLELLPGVEAVSVVEADTAEEAPPSSTVTRPEQVFNIYHSVHPVCFIKFKA
jgi:hypothetical protein